MNGNELPPMCECGQVAVKWTYVGGGEVLFQCEACYVLSGGERAVEVDVHVDSFNLRVAKKMKAIKRLGSLLRRK